MPLAPTLRKRFRRAPSAPLISPPLIIAHRGASGEAPENTLAAFDLAVRQGASAVEFDVHLSADGVPVVLHDRWLGRTTSGTGRVSDYPVSLLKRLDAGSWFNRRHPDRAQSRYANQKIPLLSQVLAWASDHGLQVFVEIKLGGGAYPGIEARVLDEIARVSMSGFATVISFDFPTLARLRRLDPRIPLGLDCTRPTLALSRAQRIGASFILPHWAFAPRRFIRRAHRARIRVGVWDLDRPRAMRRKIADGVDAAVTRYPARLRQILYPL
jgi:glycerophosphoryl diester phosphodiesterase